jgi:undecaprenyl-diphosphatase
VSIWHAILLGIVQGLTEFLPISSSAHLILIPWLAGWPESGLEFDVALHMGTLIAVLIYFRHDLLSMAGAFLIGIKQRRPFHEHESRLAWIILVGSIPAAVAGFAFNDAIDRYFHSGGGGDRSIVLISLLLILLGLILFGAERMARHVRPMQGLRWKDGVIIGCAQALALLPGVSRSGSTITAGLMTGLKRDSAARFSFLLGVPAIVGAGALETKNLIDTGMDADQMTNFVAGGVTAAIVGYVTIAGLLMFLRSNSTLVFVGYRLLLGLSLLILVALGVR